MSYVAGYTVAHDVSARDWQMRRNGGQWLIGKTFDTYCPLGPAIVTTAAISGNWSPHETSQSRVQVVTISCLVGCLFGYPLPIVGSSTLYHSGYFLRRL